MTAARVIRLRPILYANAIIILLMNLALHAFAELTEVKIFFDQYVLLSYVLVIAGVLSAVAAFYARTLTAWKAYVYGIGFYVLLVAALSGATYLTETYIPIQRSL